MIRVDLFFWRSLTPLILFSVVGFVCPFLQAQTLQPGDKYHVMFATSFTTNVVVDRSVPPSPPSFGGIEAASWNIGLATWNGDSGENWNVPYEIRPADLFGAGGWNFVDVTMRAVLSDSTANAVDHTNIQGPIFNTAGQLLANDSADFFDGTILVPINYDEYGNLITSSNKRAWSGTSASGSTVLDTCGNWDLTTGAPNTTVARIDIVNWTSGERISCSSDEARLIGVTPALTVPFPNPLAVRLQTDGPVTLSQDVRLPAATTTLAFDYRFTTTSGNLTVTLADVELGTIAAPAKLAGSFNTIELTVDPADLPTSSQRQPLTFTLDGPAGSTLLVDNVVYEASVVTPAVGMANFDFQQELVAWEVKSGVQTVSVLLGDADGDGELNNFDIASFVLALTNLPAYQAMFPNADPNVVLDMNGDGGFNNFDIADFVAALTGGKK